MNSHSMATPFRPAQRISAMGVSEILRITGWRSR